MIYGIGDLHFDYSKQKPMDIFGDNWLDHEDQIIKSWKDKVEKEDIVLIPGDISWALKLEQAQLDLKRIDDLPGKKVFIKGNHDYWWQSLKKINDLNLKSLFFIQNNSYIYKNIGIGGTRGWNSRDSDFFTEKDEKIFRREVLRLRNSLSSIEKNVEKKIAMMHYPPFDMNLKPNEFVEVMKEFNIDLCIYGHLHSEGHKYIVEGELEGIEFHCVSSDYLKFQLKSLYEE
ncbi:MAG: metallophosphoesterase [Tissierella sp.]|uniref:metallophosphoesterase n=1 Tax=Tissierella sp. TaxID=41274 RepID=UPI003F947275